MNRELTFTPPARDRGIFCNRTLNLRSIRAIGYDMDYTLVHYEVERWEERAYQHIKRKLLDNDWPLENLTFDPQLVMRGLIIDAELGNIVKANRFGYVKQALHGTKPLSFEEQRKVYSRTIIDLSDPRYYFLNTLFSLSEACIYAQLVELLDQRKLPAVMGYQDLLALVRTSVDETHMEGELKQEIVSQPGEFIVLDPETPLALQDQKFSGKKLLLITNSEWEYTQAVMAYTFDRYLPKDQTWRDLFDTVIVAARKPEFFRGTAPLFEIVSPEGHLKPTRKGLETGGSYLGGNAALVERSLELAGDEILYVGDHIFADVHVSKSVLRWRTALVLRELEQDLRAMEEFSETQGKLEELMSQKRSLEEEYSLWRLAAQRRKRRYGPQPRETLKQINEKLSDLRSRLSGLDELISPLASRAAVVNNPKWGLLMRTGNDKSHLARQLERSADIYTSRVSNFLYHSPFAYLRSHRGTLPHDE